MKLRSHLLLLAFASAAPVMVLAVVIAILVVKQERDTVRDAAGDRVVAVMSAVDAELRGSIATVRAMAASPALERGDLKAFHAQASRILGTHPDWRTFTLARPDGQRLLDAGNLPGADLGKVVDPGSFELALKQGDVVIGRVTLGPGGRYHGIPLRMPVRGTDGATHYVLTVVLKPEAFADVLREQRLPEGWVVNLIDGAHQTIARLPPLPAGTLASESLRGALARAPSGWFRGRTLEGTDVYTPYATSNLSGWALGIGMPAQTVDAAAWRSLWLVIAMVLIATGVAAGLAVLVGWRIAKPIAALATAADESGRGRAAFPRRTPIAELDSLSAALDRAAAAGRERQELIEREKAALQAADRAKDEFLAMLSHELRNPLAALTTAAHVLKLAKPDHAAAIKARAVVERQTKHMARLVGDLLDISRVVMGKVQLERERLNLADAVGALFNVWRASGRLERHKVALDLSPVWVDADRARIEQIASNLLDNAIKFTPGGKRIIVAVRPEGERALLTVTDEGEGLAPEATVRMFDLFVQGERGLDRSAGGMGVGLALVKRLTELHGGTVLATSPGVGRGATFSVRLPAVLPPAEEKAAAPAARGAPARHIVIIEDNDDTRQMLNEALTLYGHVVREARDGASGLALVAAAQPDVALIDIGLPDVDGYEVARRVRASPGGRRMGLIALTGYGQAEDQQRAFDAGFDAHLTKPVAPERLKQVMARLTS
jgi:signal transduction histidine kinase